MRHNFDIRRYLKDRMPDHFHEDSRGHLIGACLFHRDGRRPNLAVFDSGSYRCLSCQAHGNRIKLIQRVENFLTYEDAESWFNDTYGVNDDANPAIELLLGSGDKPQSAPQTAYTPPDESILRGYRFYHPYLQSRGISELWARRFDLGYDRRSRTITLPWRDRRGTLATVKHRMVADKRFYYWPRCPIKNSLVYGLHHVQRRRDTTVWITEAELDTVSLWTVGRPAVALGGNQMSAIQAREVALAGVARVVLACDRDDGGRVAHESIRQRMRAYGVECVDALWPDCGAQDANDLLQMGRLDELNIASTGLSLAM